MARHFIAALGFASLVLALSASAAAQTCAAGSQFDFEIGVYLPPGSPTLSLKVTNEAGAELWNGPITTAGVVSGASGCHWAAHVGEANPVPGDPRRVTLPANQLLTFQFSPASPYYDDFEYQLCRGLGAPYGRSGVHSQRQRRSRTTRA